jgi:ribosome-associated protein
VLKPPSKKRLKTLSSSMSGSTEEKLRSKRLSSARTEGLNEGTWVLLDYSDVVVHIFYAETRKFYDIEGLWHDADRISIDDENAAPV